MVTNKLQILLIDDEKDHVFLIKRILSLKLTNSNIDATFNGITGLKRIMNNKYDIVLLDYILPDMDGLEVLKRINKKDIKVPVIILTAKGDEEVVTKALEMGAVDYVVKTENCFENLPKIIKRDIEIFNLNQELNKLEVKNPGKVLTESKEITQLLLENLKFKIKELERAEKNYRNIMERVDEAIYECDKKGNITFINRAGLKILGFNNLNEIKGFNIIKSFYVNPEDGKPFKERIKKKGIVKNFEVQLKKKDKSIITISGTSTKKIDTFGNFIGVQGIYNDISEKKKLEHNINEANRFLTNIIENAAEAIVTVDKKGDINTFNRAAELILGYKGLELIGKSVTEICPSGEAKRIGKLLWKNDGKINNYQTIVIHKNGEKIPIRLSAVFIYDEFSNRIGSQGIFQDLSEEIEFREMEKQLIQAEKLAGLGTLSAGIAHQINNSLNGIMGMASAIFKENDLNKIKEYTKKLINYTKYGAEIVRSLGYYSGKSRGEFQRVNVNEVLNEAISIASYTIKLKKVKITTNFSKVSIISAIPSEILQLFINIIINGIEAIKDEGTLKIKTENIDKELCITIKDSGVGIPKQNIPHIFEPFFTTKIVGEGTGLGLGIAWRIASNYRGTIDVKSKKGKGSTFTIRIPMGEMKDD